MSVSDSRPPKIDRDALADIFRRVARVLNKVRPSIQADGGDVELVDVSVDGLVRIRLHGACVGCPSSSMTLREGIERNVRDHVPEVSAVEAIE
jgi:Fe-S cluster biogenesis protein NfuA